MQELREANQGDERQAATPPDAKMSCHKVGTHRHQRKKRLRLKKLTKQPYGEWAVRKFHR